MSSLASRPYDHSRSRLPGVVLLATLLLATPGVLRAQKRTTADSQPRSTTPRTGGTSDGPAPRESTFVQRLLAALAGGLAARESTTTPQSGKTQQPRMPDVVGMDTATALRRLGVGVRSRKPLVSYVIVPPSSTLIPVDRIAAQLPAAGAPVTLPVSVRLTLAGVPRPADSVTVPDVMGLLADEAERALRNRSLVVDKLEKGVTAPDSIGRVTGQNPVGGVRRAVGATVAIAIGRDARVSKPKGTGLAQGGSASQKKKPAKPTPPLVVMPGVVGRDSAAAARILRDAGLRNYRFRVPVNAASADIVRLQVPDSGRTIRADMLVVLTLRVQAAADPIPLGGISTPVVPRRSPFPWLALLAFALTFVAASALTARRVWPPPQIVPRIRLEPMLTDIIGANGSLVDVSISLSSHVEHEQSVLDLVGSSFD